MRETDPELDAWLNFFGKVTSFKTTESERIFNDLKKQYLIPSMAK
jgi:hypothetical protein